MDEFSTKLANIQNGKFSFLRLLSVVYDETLNLCELTFLFPENIQQIDNQMREEIKNFAQENIPIKGKIKVKFKRSFLD